MAKRKEINQRRDLIRAWFDLCDINDHEHREALKRAARMIFSRQTAEEQDTKQTRDLNGRGFNGRDGEFGANIANWRGDMTLKMARPACKMLRKYAGQLAEMKLAEQ